MPRTRTTAARMTRAEELERAVEAALSQPGGFLALIDRIQAAHPAARPLAERIHRAVVAKLAGVVAACGPQAVADVINEFPRDGE